MTPLQIVLLVLGILAVNAVLWVFIWRWIVRTNARHIGELQIELGKADERVLLGPEPGLYRGATSNTGLPRTKGNSVVALTERRLVVRKLVGISVEIPTADIVGVRTDKWFEGAWTGGRMHVIVKLRTGGEIGLFVRDTDAWVAALQKLAS